MAVHGGNQPDMHASPLGLAGAEDAGAETDPVDLPALMIEECIACGSCSLTMNRPFIRPELIERAFPYWFQEQRFHDAIGHFF